MNKTLMQTLLEAGYARDQIFNHYSDMYVYVTPLTERIIAKWYPENGLNTSLFVSKFRSNIDGQMMYDCKFAYDDYWAERE